MRLEKARDFPAAAGDLQSHPIRGQQTIRQHRDPFRGARHPTIGTNLSFLADRDNTEIAVYIQADRSTRPSR
jgi:hypothetical protein